MLFSVIPARRFLADLLELFVGTFETHRPPQFFRLAAGKIRDVHRHFQKLLLKQRNAQRAFEDRL